MNSDGHTPFWDDLAIKYNYDNGEKLRDHFKKERKRRGIQSRDKSNDKKNNIINSSKPRVLVFDLESLPGIAFYWRLWDINIQPSQVIQDVCLLGWAGKFLNDSTMYSDILTPSEAKKRDVARITKSCWNLLSQTDVVIGHNISSFDIKYMNTAFIKCGLPPLKFVLVDTLQVARQNFHFSSNKLEFINDQLGMRNKLDDGGFETWRACSNGDADALAKMKNYNEGDIYSTEDLFYKFRPYVRNFNIALYNEMLEPQCPVCGSTNLKEEGEYFTSAGKWKSIRCQDCQCLSRKKNNLLSKEKRKSLLINS